MEKPHRLAEMPSHKRILAWAHELIRVAESYGAPKKYLTESKKSKPYSNYVACLCDIMDAEVSSYEKVAEKEGMEGCHGGGISVHSKE
jgi:hypothetical protein